MWKYNHALLGDELMHYGILGMKWGVRRTPAQLARAGGHSKPTKRDADENASEDYKRARSKSTKEMSDVELQSAIRRLQMEKQYRDLNPQQVSTGKRLTSRALKAVEDVAFESAKTLAKDYVTKKGKKYLGLNDEKSDFDKEMDVLGKMVRYTTMKKTYKTNTGNDWSYTKKK